MKKITLGFSPCPNDTFIFFALAGNHLSSNFDVEVTIKDIEVLNSIALRNDGDIVKVSCFAYGKIAKDYTILRSGAALGKGCGPLLLSKGKGLPDEDDKIAVPGELTTANFLLKLFLGKEAKTFPLAYDRIMPSLSEEKIDYGVIIHEGRFTYPKYGLSQIRDLGQFWEESYNLPIPLGIIAAKRSLGEDTIREVEASIAESISYSYEHQDAAYDYMRAYAKEMDDEVFSSYLDLYVNDYTQRLGEEGERAIVFMLQKAVELEFLPPFPLDRDFLFLN